MRSTCCVQQPSSSNHQHHHNHQPCHVFPSSISVPLFSASTGMGNSTGGGCGGGGGAMISNGGGNCCPSSHHTTVFNGTATLPASYSSNGGDHFAATSSSSTSCSYFRSRTIGPNAQHCALVSSFCPCEHPNGCQLYSNWLPFSRRAIALFALSLVFILIWSSVVSYVLLSDSFKEQQTTRQTAELFELHRDVGQLAFEMGEEMLFTLNATMFAMNQLDFQTSNSTSTATNISTKSTNDPVNLDRTLNKTTSTSTFDNSSITTIIPPTNSTFTTAKIFSGHPLQMINARWNKTDVLLRQIGQSLATKGYLDFESDVNDQLEKLRSKCVHQVGSAWPSDTVTTSPQLPPLTSTADPLARIAQTNNQTAKTTNLVTLTRTAVLWPLLADCVRTFEQSFALLDRILMKEHFASFVSSSVSRSGEKQQHAQYSKMAMTDLLIRNMPYTLFVRGIVHRFTSLSFGLILVRSNFTQPFNVSEYFHYYYSSRQLIESSFVWNYRFLAKYQELESTDYQADMLLTFFDSRRVLENEYYLKMSAIFSRVFSFEKLVKIRSYIKKKNVESVERMLLVNNGSGTQFIADQEANLMSIQLNTDLIELMGLENIEQVMYGHDQLLTQPTSANLQQKYDRLLRNQIGFMSRVQDFLNISLSAHLTGSTINGEQSLHYRFVLCTILLLSVFFTLTLFTCSGCCYRSPGVSNSCCQQTSAVGKLSAVTTFSRRFRRRLWHISYSPFSLFKLCFNGSPPFFSNSNSGAATSSSATSPPRYPLLYKSTYLQPHSPSSNSRSFGVHRSCHPHHYCHHHHNHHYSTVANSPSSHMITSGRRATGPAVVVNRSNFQATTTSREVNKVKTEKSRYQSNDKPNTTEAISLIDRDSKENKTTTVAEPSCMCCIDNRCSTQQNSLKTISDVAEKSKKAQTNTTSTASVSSSDATLFECSKCSINGKCSLCQCKTLISTDEQQHELPKNSKEPNSNSSTSVMSSNSSCNSKESAKKDTSKHTLLNKTP